VTRDTHPIGPLRFTPFVNITALALSLLKVKPKPSGVQFGAYGVGKVQEAGGDVIPTPNNSDPYHGEINGITPEQASELFKPTVTNLWKPR
jgi:hypothetical protein